MSELAADVRDGRTVLKQQGREGVAHLVRATAVQLHGVKDPIERLPDVRLVERRARHGQEHPVRERLSVLQPGGSLPTSPKTELGSCRDRSTRRR